MIKENGVLGVVEEGNNKNKVILNLIGDFYRFGQRNKEKRLKQVQHNDGRTGYFSGCHPEFVSGAGGDEPEEFIKQAENPGQRPAGMTTLFHNNIKAFTLIELLVVVLIIGILAAVALPQYKVAVAKSRMSQLLTLADAVRKAEEVYYMANGRYTQNWDELDISISGTVQGSYLLPGNGVRLFLRTAPFSVAASDSRLPSSLIVGFYNQNEGDLFNGGRSACYAPTTDTLGNILCKNISNRQTGDTVNSGGSSKRYFF